jgi:hypothetical protein
MKDKSRTAGLNHDATLFLPVFQVLGLPGLVTP